MHLGLKQLLIITLVAFSVFSHAQDDDSASDGDEELIELEEESDESESTEQDQSASESVPAPAPTQQPMNVPDSSPSGFPYAQVVDESFNNRNPNIPYRDRRGTWGALVSIGYSNYSPSDYDPDFVTTGDYEEFYSNVDSPLIEATISAKLNVSFFSLTVDVGAGHFSNEGEFASSLSLTPVRLGGTLALDGIFSEPYVVPYAGGGLYTVFYTEKLASQKVEGRTTPAPYFHVGSKFQLDWIDQQASSDSLIEYGLENTFIYVEGRYFMASGDRVPDLSSPDDSPFMINAGLTVEF